MHDNRKKIVTRALILMNGKVLLGKRGRGPGAGQFALIGGKPEEGETLDKAIVREVKEELGLSLINPKLWKQELDKTSVAGESWNVYYFVGGCAGDAKLKTDEVAEIVWVDKNNFTNYDIAFDHKDILEEFFLSIL